MTRIDWIVSRRIFSRIVVTVLVFFSLIALVESLDAWRFTNLSKIGGPQLALLAIVTNTIKWVIKTLPVTVLIGAIIGVLDLQSRRELTVIKATGLSIWRIMRAPVLGIVLVGLGIAIFAEGANTEVNRGLNPSPPGATGGLTDGELWLEQTGDGQRYILKAGQVKKRGVELADIAVFYIDQDVSKRVLAPKAWLQGGEWILTDALVLSENAPRVFVASYRLPTTSTSADLNMKLGSTEDFTLNELTRALASNITDPAIHAAVMTRLLRLLSLPILLTGSLLIAFAFTAGYRRTNKYGPAVLYGIVLGFVVFVVTEMADRAGSSGVLDPAIAAIGPAFVAIVIGLTVLLHKEDGQA